MSIFRERLDQAAQYIDAIERLVSMGSDACAFSVREAAADFNLCVPKNWELAGCKKTCPLFCRCSPELYESESQERHDLFMRYFDVMALVKKLTAKNEQLSLGLSGKKNARLYNQGLRKIKTRQSVSEEEQLSLAI